jgi:hypothetical protein
MIEAAMPMASALWDPLTAGSSVSCINTFAPSDDYLCDKSTSSTCTPVSNPPPVHSIVTPLVSFFGNSVLHPVLPPAAPSLRNQPFFNQQPTTDIFIGTTSHPTHQHIARPATIIFFQKAVTTVLPDTIMSLPSYPSETSPLQSTSHQLAFDYDSNSTAEQQCHSN